MKIRRGIQFLLPLWVVFLLLSSSALAAQAVKAKNGNATEITLDFQDVELVDLVSTISELTGKNFIYDESLRGKVSIISPRAVSIDEAYALFTTVLNVKGFTIVPSGNINKIVPIRDAKEENLPVTTGRGVGEQYVTRLIDLKNLDAQVVTETILRPLIPKTSYVIYYAPTNSVIITDSAANIDRLVKLIDTLDKSIEGEKMELVKLQYADADDTADLVMQIMEGSDSTTTQVRRKSSLTASHRKIIGQVIPYGRTNKLILVGDQDFITEAKSIIAELDEKADQSRASMHVYYLENAQAEPLAATLNQIITGVSADQTKKTPIPAAVAAAAQGKQFGSVTVTADKPTNSLIINSSPEDYSSIKDLIAQLDIKRKQVFVEALILEVSMDKLLQLGSSIQGAVSTDSDSVVFGTNNQNAGGSALLAPIPDSSVLATAVEGVLLGGLFNPITTTINGEQVTIPALSALIQLSKTDQDINILSAPRLLTSDNEEAEIVVGANVPIITSKTKDTAGQVVNSVERKDVALTLRYTPQITEGDLVRLKIYQEISDVAPTSQTVGTVDEVGPTFNTRKLSNTIIARDGKTVVLGGLFQTNHKISRSKVPLLGDIPLLGYLFRSKSDQEVKTSLLIFITPKVIRTSEDLERVTRESQANLGQLGKELGEKDALPPTPAEKTQPVDSPAEKQEQPAKGGD